jgi:short-subunit dehydrogenase
MIGSMAGLAGLPYAASYAATKAALLALANSLRLELRDRGVSASTVIPGFIAGAGMYEEQQELLARRAQPALLGTTSATAVAAAVVRAIRDDVPEILVNPGAARLAAALGRLFPRLGLWAVARTSRDYMAAVAEARAARGGESAH